MHGQDVTQGQFLSGVKQTGWLTKDEEPSLPYNLPIAEGRMRGFIVFTKA